MPELENIVKNQKGGRRTGEIIMPPTPPITITEGVSTTVETTVIPEFTTIAIPVAAIFGIVMLMQRRRKQK